MGNLAIAAAVTQLGGLDSPAVITTNSDGSALDVLRLQYEHIRNGPNKNAIRYTPSLKMDDFSGFYFVNGVSVPIPSPLPFELLAVTDGAGTDAQREAAAGLLDWSKKIGNQWVCTLLIASVMRGYGSKVTMVPGGMKAVFPLLQLYKTYEEDPAFVA